MKSLLTALWYLAFALLFAFAAIGMNHVFDELGIL